MQMITLKETYNVVNDTMKILENIKNKKKKIKKKQKIHKAYRKLDNFRDELIRENIINKQKQGGTND